MKNILLNEVNMSKFRFLSIIFLLLILNLYCLANNNVQKQIPLPEHPRPDFMRNEWLNLNGPWQFRFDPQNIGIKQNWQNGNTDFPLTITVPFSWGSKLSGVNDEADIGWYSRYLKIPESWKGKRVFMVIGACDWHSTAWIDGHLLGTHQGGYTPFEFELTKFIKFGNKQQIVLRVDDTPHDFKLEGKQGYGRAAGIWQTIYLEARPRNFIKTIHFIPDIDNEKVKVSIKLDKQVPDDTPVQLLFPNSVLNIEKIIIKGNDALEFETNIQNPHLWSLDDPFLYQVDVVLKNRKGGDDRISTYFGMRKISVNNIPGTNIPYIALNNKPIYLRMTLDQAYHPEGYYTFPSDEFMRDEILRTKRLGLNGQRIHVKIGIPRKLYWADKIGILIMADVPNSWGEPSPEMRQEVETALRGMIERDYNHPAIFSWVIFNETWGLLSDGKRDYEGWERDAYLPETQEWVASLYHLAKQLDPTRLVEDNSACNFDHVVTDINSWHAYIPGYEWRDLLDKYIKSTFPGSKWNFIGGRSQKKQPLLNSECGNVWGYKGSTGDIDWSWDYHLMMNEFRRHPKVCGWLYTEHHDVINEWNGYYRYDRSRKFTGLSEIVPGMSLKDLHADYYLATEKELCREVKPNTIVNVPLYLSILTDQVNDDVLLLKTKLFGWDNLGFKKIYWEGQKTIPCAPWFNKELTPLKIRMPDKPGLVVLSFILEDLAGNVLHRNFTTYLVADGPSSREETILLNDKRIKVLRFAPNSYTNADWSLKKWEVLNGLKVNGAGSGYFEYAIKWPQNLAIEEIEDAGFRIEVSAKQLFSKDKEERTKLEGDFMRGKGTHDPSLNPNAYPMTDEKTFPSRLRIRINGQVVGVFDLKDDPADHRGILSWFSQKRDGRLREAGSYGYLISTKIPIEVLKLAESEGKIIVRLEVDDVLPGGLAIYGERFGRYPVDPSIIFVMKK